MKSKENYDILLAGLGRCIDLRIKILNQQKLSAEQATQLEELITRRNKQKIDYNAFPSKRQEINL